MTECPYPEIRDSLPDLLHGRLGEVDTATLTTHVESCAACRAELALLREVRASAPLAPRIDVERIAAALPVRCVVVAEPSRQPLGIRSPVWKFAAAIAIAISGGLLVQERGGVDGVAAPSNTVAASSLPAEAEGGSTRVEAPAIEGEGSLSLVAGVHELTDDQIESLLVELDAIEMIPSEEPEQGMIYLEAE